MMDLPAAYAILRQPGGEAAFHVSLGYDQRFLRRKRLVTDEGPEFIVDLPETSSLEDGDCFQLRDNTRIMVRAALEPVVIVRGDLPRLAWHIGNRHTPCQIGADYLVIRADHVLEAMLRGLGADVRPAMAPFRPEGGAYGHGRTLGHEHGGRE